MPSGMPQVPLPARPIWKLPKLLDGRNSPFNREARGHPFAGFHRVNNGGLAGFELAGSNHFIEMKQDGRPAAVAGVGTPKFSAVPSNAEAAYKRVVLRIVKLDRGN